jgi:hypothetical protein
MAAVQWYKQMILLYQNKWKIPEHHLRGSAGLGVVQLV